MRLTEKKENGFYELKEGQEIYGEENGIRLVQIVGEYEDIDESPEHLADVKKAFEIIKEKRVNVGSFIKCCANISYEEYKKEWGNWEKDILYNLSKEPLSQEEYDLVRKVLL